jgi:hypothetical protein
MLVEKGLASEGAAGGEPGKIPAKRLDTSDDE